MLIVGSGQDSLQTGGALGLNYLKLTLLVKRPFRPARRHQHLSGVMGRTWLVVDTVTSQHERQLLPAGPPLCGCSQPALPAVAHLTAAPLHSLMWQQLVALCCVPASIRSPVCVLTVAACIVTAGADPAKSCCPCWSSCRR